MRFWCRVTVLRNVWLWHHWRFWSAESEVLCVQLLVWKAGPSFTEAVSMLMDFPVGETSLERQSAALFLAPEIHLKGNIVSG